MQTDAVVIDQPRSLATRRVELDAPGPADVVVDVRWSGVSTGTERLLWDGSMPPFPGMGYPLVPGYEAVGEVVLAGPDSDRRVGDRVFVPGARCFGGTRSLFGGAARRLTTPGPRTVRVRDDVGERAALLALAATAYHAAWGAGGSAPELIVGHGALGRLLARLTVALGAPPPTVWERRPERRAGATGYAVIDPADDDRHDYRAIHDVSGDAGVLDALVSRCAPGGEVVLAGFYTSALRFEFVPAFLRETRLRVAAQWQPADLDAVTQLVMDGRLSLDGIISHRAAPGDAARAYTTAFGDPDCVKMILDWGASA